MSSLSNAEKQKILRERRQAKLKSSAASRLNKITTSNSSLKSTIVNNTPKETPSIPTNNNVSAKRSNRISSILDVPPASVLNLSNDEVSQVVEEEEEHDDPEIEDISNFRNDSFNALNGTQDEPQFSPEAFQNDFLKNLLGNDGSQPDLFGKMMTDPEFMKGFPGNNDSGVNNQPVSDDHRRYYTYKSNKFKASFMLFRMFFLTFFIVYSHLKLNIQLSITNTNIEPHILLNASQFYTYFISLEAVFISYFIFHLNNIKHNFQFDSIIPETLISLLGFVLPPNLITSMNVLNKYYQFFKFFSFDVIYSVFLLILLTIIF